MPKVDLELVKMIMQRNEVDIRLVSQVIEDINEELKNQVEEKTPVVKKKFVMMVSDPEGELPEKDYVGWVLQIPEDDGEHVTEERLVKAAYAFNQTPKGRRMPVQSVAEICEHVPARYLKEEQIWVKTKEPVYMLKTTNKIPWDDSKGGF